MLTGPSNTISAFCRAEEKKDEKDLPLVSSIIATSTKSSSTFTPSPSLSPQSFFVSPPELPKAPKKCFTLKPSPEQKEAVEKRFEICKAGFHHQLEKLQPLLNVDTPDTLSATQRHPLKSVIETLEKLSSEMYSLYKEFATTDKRIQLIVSHVQTSYVICKITDNFSDSDFFYGDEIIDLRTICGLAMNLQAGEKDTTASRTLQHIIKSASAIDSNNGHKALWAILKEVVEKEIPQNNSPCCCIIC